MKTIETSVIPLEILESKLAADDDRDLWKAALVVLGDEFMQRRAEKSTRRDWAMLVGACSHWVRPHNSRWNAAGGFVFPEGYQDHLPELDWSLILVIRDRKWTPLSKLPGKKVNLLRVAIPSRTVRHRQAVVHTQWSPGGEIVLYGFRKVGEKWECVAASNATSGRRRNIRARYIG